MTRKQMEARVDDIAAFTELGDYLSMPLRTYSTGMRVRLALGVVTSIDPEILLLDEGIGAVDAEFLAKARERLNELVERSGILVFASHSDEFLADLCDTAIWMEHGPDPRARAAARGAAPLQGPRRAGRARVAVKALPPGSVVGRRRHPAPRRAAGRLAGRDRQADPPDRAPHRRRQRARPAGPRGRRGLRAARHLAAVVAQPRRRGRVRARHAARARAGRGLGLARRRRRPRRRRQPCSPPSSSWPSGAGWRPSPRSSPTPADPDRLAFPVRRGLTWHRSRARAGRRPSTAPTTSSCPASPRCSTARCSGRPRWTSSACRTCGCSSAATRWRCTGGCVRSGLPFGTALSAVYLHPRAAATTSRCSAGGCTPSDPDDPVKRYYTYRNRGYLMASRGCGGSGCSSCPRFAWYFLVTRAARGSSRGGCGCVRQGRRSASTARGPSPRRQLSARKTTVRSITKLITVASALGDHPGDADPQRHVGQHAPAPARSCRR